MKTLRNYDDFYTKGEPRTLSDWDQDNQMNAVLNQLMIASGVERIDEILIPGHLHLKLRNRLKYFERYFEISLSK